MRSRELFLAALLAACAETKAAKLQGFDALAPVDEPVRLEAKLERDGILGVNPDLRDEEVVFWFGGSRIGSARTAGEGIAALSWTPIGEGVHEVEARLAEGSAYAAAPAPLRVFVRRRERPVLVVDLDGTICLGSSLDVARKPPAEVPEFPGAPKALRSLARHYDVVYLSARDDALTARSRAWLDAKEFPKGPLLVRDLTLRSLSAESYKKKRLAALRRTWRLVAGVGDRDEDAEAYLDAGMTAILVGDETSVPEGARKLVTWEEVEKLLTP